MFQTMKSEFCKRPLTTSCAVAAALGIWIALATVIPYVVMVVIILVGAILWRESRPREICSDCKDDM